jgi:hypothetical protein
VPNSQYGESNNGSPLPTHVPITKLNLIVKGLAHFQAIANTSPMIQDHLTKDVLQLSRKLQQITISSKILVKILKNKVVKLTGQSLPDQIDEIIKTWEVIVGSELMLCKALCSQVIPCIKNDKIDMELVYDRIEVLLNTHSDNSDSPDVESTIQSPVDDLKEEEVEPVVVVEEKISQVP